MKHLISGLFLGTALALAAGGSALAQDKNIKIGVLTDNSGLYSDLGGAGSTLAAQMAIEDSGMAAKGWKINLISADHQNKPDIATTIARQWIDVEKVDILMDVLNSGVALAVNNVVKEKNSIMINTGAATSDLTNAQCSPNTVHWVYDTYMATYLGVPVSTTHTITGAIVGVGAARRVSAVRWNVASSIVYAWMITIPASAIVAALTYGAALLLR